MQKDTGKLLVLLNYINFVANIISQCLSALDTTLEKKNFTY